MIKSPLRYPGGKSRAVRIIAPIVPEFSEYREPFLGGGSIFVHQKQQHPEKKFWINDIYPNLFHFWSQTQQDVEGMLEQVLLWREEYEEGKKLHRFLLDNVEGFEDLQKAAAFFVLNRITFSGTSESGGFSNGAYKQRFTPSSIERVRTLATILDDVKITNQDYQELLEAEGEDVFVFLDPPYYSATKSALYGKNGHLHKGFDHERFAESLKKCKHKWLVTYDDSEHIRELFSFADITEWNLTYGMRNVTEGSEQKAQELFISNFHVNHQKPLTQRNLFEQESELVKK